MTSFWAAGLSQLEPKVQEADQEPDKLKEALALVRTHRQHADYCAS